MTADVASMAIGSRGKVESRRQIFVHAGQLAAASEPTLIVTILGSCVAICLWDSARRTGGMNHFMLPFAPSPQNESPRFGGVAWTSLLAKMSAMGARREDLRAGIFGGACVMDAFRGAPGEDIGGRNIELAEAQLASAGITVMSRETGGRRGRKVTFDTESGHVTVREL